MNNRRMGTYLPDSPDNEVRKGFLSLPAANYLKPDANRMGSRAEE